MFTLNDSVMVEPIKLAHDSGERKTRGFDMTDKLANDLVPTKVMADAKNLKAGDVVYIRADSLIHPAARQVYKINGLDCSIISEAMIILVERPPQPRPAALPPSGG